METVVIESCHSRWLFDVSQQRFRRILKGLQVSDVEVTTEWRPYFGLEFQQGSDSFVVLLNPEGTRLLRSWRHVEGHCTSCDSATTQAVARQPAGSTAVL